MQGVWDLLAAENAGFLKTEASFEGAGIAWSWLSHLIRSLEFLARLEGSSAALFLQERLKLHHVILQCLLETPAASRPSSASHAEHAEATGGDFARCSAANAPW